jgi:tripartite-type tricarboxylate transporter receptor subunit TctC
MILARRKFLYLATGAAGLLAASQIVGAESYPTRPVRIIVGFAPGGPVDIVARLISQWLSQRLGQQFIVENRPGAAGNIATEVVVNSPADGYTLLLVGASNTINPTLYERLRFDFARDIVPVAGIIRSTLLMLVNPSIGPESVSEFIAYARINPGKVNFGSGGTGTSSHMAGELFRAKTAVSMVHLPYRGEAPALNDLIGGQIQVMFGNMSSSIEFVRAGKLRALAVTTAARAKSLPDVPTVEELVPGYEVSGMNGLGAPKGTPAEIVQKLNLEINAALSDANMAARLADAGGMPLPGSAADYSGLLGIELEKWGQLIKVAKIRPE